MFSKMNARPQLINARNKLRKNLYYSSSGGQGFVDKDKLREDLQDRGLPRLLPPHLKHNFAHGILYNAVGFVMVRLCEGDDIHREWQAGWADRLVSFVTNCSYARVVENLPRQENVLPRNLSSFPSKIDA
jgi:hypothetical protein